MHCYWGHTATKKRNVATLNSADPSEKQCNFDTSWLEQQGCLQNCF